MPILLRCLLSEFYKILICKILQIITHNQKQFNHFCTYFTYLLYIHITIAIQITYIIRANTFVLSRFSHGIRTQQFSREKKNWHAHCRLRCKPLRSGPVGCGRRRHRAPFARRSQSVSVGCVWSTCAPALTVEAGVRGPTPPSLRDAFAVLVTRRAFQRVLSSLNC